MSSTDSPSEVRSSSAEADAGTRAWVLPAALAGCDADGPRAPEDPTAHGLLAALRRFHLSGEVSEPLSETLLPASLLSTASTGDLSENTLLLLGTDAEATGICGTLLLWPSLIQRLTEATAATNGTSVLQQHLDEFHGGVAQILEKHSGVAPATEVFEAAGRQWLKEHKGDAEAREALLRDIQCVCDSWGSGARILLPSEHAYLHLLLHVIEHESTTRRALLRHQIEERAELLRAFLAVDSTKDSMARSAEGLQRNMGRFGAAFLDTQQLSHSLGPHRGAAQLAPEQRRRAEAILDSLHRALSDTGTVPAVVLHDGSIDADTWNGAPCERVMHDDPCQGAAELFEQRARASADLFRDMHIAQLLLENRYEPIRHDPWFERFDWRGFTQDELWHLPTVVVVDTAEHLAGAHLSSLSALLLSGKPVQVLASQSAAQNPTSPEELDRQTRMELGYLGMGHRKAFVQQASLQQPLHLTEGFRQALECLHPALHVVARQGTSKPQRDWLAGEAAILARAHPLFCYNPEGGSTWAQRMDFTGNPQPHLDWPTEKVGIQDDAGSHHEWLVPCTFADFVLLEPRLHRHFMRVADELRSEDLLRLDQYLQLPTSDVPHHLPWIWASDSSGKLHRLLVSRRLVRICRDRLDYWHTLQELAGVRNQYVEDAVEQTREEERRAYELQIQRLQSEHAAALTSLERQTVQKSMRRLSRMLLDLDPLSTTADVAPAAASKSTAATSAETPATDVSASMSETASAAASAAPETEVPSPPSDASPQEQEDEEPWIESALCTSCNDCLQINGQLFVYDANKQARIGDPHSGTFEQLVRAAEKCPAHCIHPGTPLNKQEANLESLMQRAAPFN